MRIYDRDLSGVASAESGRSQEAQRAEREQNPGKAGGTSAAGQADRVEFSSSLASVSRALSSNSQGRSEKVSALAAQFQAGSYQPNSLATSQSMVSDALSGGAK